MPVMSLIIIAIAMIAMAMTSAAAEDGRPAEKSFGPDSTYLPAYQKHNEQQPQGPTGPLPRVRRGKRHPACRRHPRARANPSSTRNNGACRPIPRFDHARAETDNLRG
jgi:hypothetical protein